jgi:hypothetical protein
MPGEGWTPLTADEQARYQAASNQPENTMYVGAGGRPVLSKDGAGRNLEQAQQWDVAQVAALLTELATSEDGWHRNYVALKSQLAEAALPLKGLTRLSSAAKQEPSIKRIVNLLGQANQSGRVKPEFMARIDQAIQYLSE